MKRQSKWFGRATAIALVALNSLLLAPASAIAGTVSWSGTLQSPDPTWNRVSGGCFGATSNEEWYDVHTFQVLTTGTYTLAMTSMTGGSPDAFFALYQTSFNPNTPAANCIATDDDSGAISSAPLITRQLTAFTQYLLVTTQCCDGISPNEAIAYTNTISGPGVGTSQVSEPGALALLALGVAGVGLSRRRRPKA